MRRNPLAPLADNARRQARLDAGTAADATQAQTPAGSGPTPAGTMDGSGLFAPAGRLDIDGLDGEMRLA